MEDTRQDVKPDTRQTDLTGAPASTLTLKNQVRALDFVQRVEPYHPWYRLERELREWMGQEPDQEPTEMRVNVQAFEWGAEGTGPGEFNNPNGISFVNSEFDIAVSDTGNDRTQIFGSVGVFIFECDI